MYNRNPSGNNLILMLANPLRNSLKKLLGRLEIIIMDLKCLGETDQKTFLELSSLDRQLKMGLSFLI